MKSKFCENKTNELFIADEENNLIKKISDWHKQLAEHLKIESKTLDDKINLLSIIRKDLYEDLNQIQHKALIIKAAKFLQKKHPIINKWTWHPMQTSHPEYADLTGYNHNKVILNAEVTTSIVPVGSIDTRMKSTLTSLAAKKGDKYYFVQTENMFNRAITKIEKGKFGINVIVI